jgi:hypothetical protein
MANTNGNAYALTTFCPIKPGADPDPSSHGRSHVFMLRDVLEDLPLNHRSPMARVPNTYLCRFYVLNDMIYQGRTDHGKPVLLDHLKSKYLVFTSNFYGELEPYLQGMWRHAEKDVVRIWRHCIGFDQVRDASGFVRYIQKCQLTTTFFFNGSLPDGETLDQPLAEQLKALYLKQELSEFAFANQGKSPQELQEAFKLFVARTKPREVEGPTWRAGADDLGSAVIDRD